MPWKICFTLQTIPPRIVCYHIPVLLPKRRLPVPPPPPEPWLEDVRVKATTFNNLVTLNTISELAGNLAPAARKQVQSVVEASFKDLKLPAEYALHFVE